MVEDEFTPGQPSDQEAPTNALAVAPIVKERKPLNPAYAILVGAVLTAITGITATYLNIQSSERLARERDRTDLARLERDSLQKELDHAKAEIATKASLIDGLVSSTTSAPVISVPPSIIVILPPQVPATVRPTDSGSSVGSTAPTTAIPTTIVTLGTSIPTSTVTTTSAPTPSTTTLIASTLPLGTLPPNTTVTISPVSTVASPISSVILPTTTRP